MAGVSVEDREAVVSHLAAGLSDLPDPVDNESSSHSGLSRSEFRAIYGTRPMAMTSRDRNRELGVTGCTMHEPDLSDTPEELY
jgi:hypothetical protein